MEQVEVEGLRIAYERAGEGGGPPVLLVHGFVGDGLSTWSAVIDAIGKEHTVLAWDAPGAGRSTRPPESFRMPDYADALAAFLRALGVTRAHLVGLSFGSAVVLQTWAKHPSLPLSLALVSGYAGWAGSLGREGTEQRLRFCLDVAGLPPREFVSAMLPSMFSPSAPPDAVARFAESLLAADPDGFRTMSRASAEADLRDVLPTVDVPTLLLYGDRDVRAPLPVGRALASSIPGSRLVVLPGVGHVSPVEAPEAVARELRDFLRSVVADAR